MEHNLHPDQYLAQELVHHHPPRRGHRHRNLPHGYDQEAQHLPKENLGNPVFCLSSTKSPPHPLFFYFKNKEGGGCFFLPLQGPLPTIILLFLTKPNLK